MSRRSSVVAADERRLEPVAAAAAAALGDDPDARHAGDRRGLALERLLAGRLEGDRAGGRPLGRLADEDRARAARRTGAGWRC